MLHKVCYLFIIAAYFFGIRLVTGTAAENCEVNKCIVYFTWIIIIGFFKSDLLLTFPIPIEFKTGFQLYSELKIQFPCLCSLRFLNQYLDINSKITNLEYSRFDFYALARSI